MKRSASKIQHSMESHGGSTEEAMDLDQPQPPLLPQPLPRALTLAESALANYFGYPWTRQIAFKRCRRTWENLPPGSEYDLIRHHAAMVAKKHPEEGWSEDERAEIKAYMQECARMVGQKSVEVSESAEEEEAPEDHGSAASTATAGATN